MTRAAVTVELAGSADEPALRRLLRETPLAGRISLSLEREPDLAWAAAVEGHRHDLVVGRVAGEPVALAARSVRTVFVNGAPARIGYLGLLRLALPLRGGIGALRAGFALLRSRRREDELPFDFTSIVSDNAPARRLLEAGVSGFPIYRPLGELTTLALAPRPRRATPPRGVEVEPGAPDRLAEIAAFLCGDGVRRQLAPSPSPADLASPERSRGLAPEDFLLATRRGRLAGCAALWDQRGFKQAVVRGYAPLLALARPFVNLVAPIVRLPSLPAPGAALRAAYVAHLAVSDDDPAVLDALVDAALAAARARGLAHVLLGLAADHPLLAIAQRRRHVALRSTVYAVHAPDDAAGAAAVAALDGRVLGPEVATL